MMRNGASGLHSIYHLRRRGEKEYFLDAGNGIFYEHSLGLSLRRGSANRLVQDHVSIYLLGQIH